MSAVQWNEPKRVAAHLNDIDRPNYPANLVLGLIISLLPLFGKAFVKPTEMPSWPVMLVIAIVIIIGIGIVVPWLPTLFPQQGVIDKYGIGIVRISARFPCMSIEKQVWRFDEIDSITVETIVLDGLPYKIFCLRKADTVVGQIGFSNSKTSGRIRDFIAHQHIPITMM